jgi:transcriptional regulator of acetoin/glycerol metabolism
MRTDSSLSERAVKDVLALTQSRRHLVDLPTHVKRSWQRCLNAYGINPDNLPETEICDGSQLRLRRQRLGTVLGIAKAEMENLYEQIAGSGYAVILTDAEATVLHSIIDPTLHSEFRQAGLRCGARWGERQHGTNGIGTCIAEQKPVTVHRGEHFLSSHISLSCSGTPIVDAHGVMIGVLDASSVAAEDTRLVQRHTMALVNMSAALIARAHFLHEFRDAWVMGFHSRPELVGLLHEALLAIDGEGQVLAVNDVALELLGKPDRNMLVGLDIDEVLQIDFAAIERRAAADAGVAWPIRCTDHGRRFHAVVRPPHKPLPVSREHPLPAPRPVRTGSDPVVRRNLDVACRLAQHRVPLLLQGDTGSGKHELARAVHAAMPWAERPFVVLNCVALSESHIHADLLCGRDPDAPHSLVRMHDAGMPAGTLFLEDIDELSPAAQARLLRTIDQGQIESGLQGAGAMHLIGASRNDLAARVAAQRFREDLYYRLNGSTLRMPPLRERKDLEELIATILAEECAGHHVPAISASARRALLGYAWPGNLRQLRNTLRAAVALCRRGSLRLQHLPALSAPDAGDARDPGVGDSLEKAECNTLVQQLHLHDWNVSATAAALHISRNTLYRKLHKHGIASRK